MCFQCKSASQLTACACAAQAEPAEGLVEPGACAGSLCSLRAVEWGHRGWGQGQPRACGALHAAAVLHAVLCCSAGAAALRPQEVSLAPCYY